MSKNKVSVCLSTFNRDDLLKCFLSNLIFQRHDFDLEVVVVNDGYESQSKNICESFKKDINLKYFFSGKRNKEGEPLVMRNPCFANNISIKNASSDIIILTNPEIYLFKENVLDMVVKDVLSKNKVISIPSYIFFDEKNVATKFVKENRIKDLNFLFKNFLMKRNNKIQINRKINDPLLFRNGIKGNGCDVRMPFFMGLYKKYVYEIGGYDEDFIGYAGEDNDFVNRLKKIGLNHSFLDFFVMHMYHGERCDNLRRDEKFISLYNYNCELAKKKNDIIRNNGREWGVIEQ